MTTDVLDVIKNIQNLYENNSSLAALKDFERVLDELGVYVYDNWIDGELVEGPYIDRHWITVKFMWPYENKPDPRGAKLLLNMKCIVKYRESHLIKPRPIKSPADIRPGTKKGKLDRERIWVVEIQMPKTVAFNIYRGYMDKMQNEQISNAPKYGTPVPGAAPVPSPSPAAGMTPPAGGMPPSMPAGGAGPMGAPM